MAFNKTEFDKQFPAKVEKLVDSEKITKAILMELSRSVLEALHATEDISYVNKVVAALTPVNRKVAILYFQEFGGFREEGGVFTKKDKKVYEKAKQAAITFLEDPHNNIWSWAEKEIDVAPKAFDLAKVTQTTQSLLKKSKDAGFTQADVLRAMFAAGFEVDALLEAMSNIAIPKQQAPAPVDNA